MRRSVLFLLMTATALGCGVAEEGVPAPSTTISFPVGLAAHPDGRYLYIANSVFDRRYRNGTVMVYDTQSESVLGNATFSTGLFSGELVVGRRTPDGPVFGYVASREKNHLVQFGVDSDAGDAVDHLSETSVAESFGGRTFADDPYGLAVDTHGLTVTHLGRGVVSRWGLDENDSLVFRCSLSLSEGATFVARHPVLGTWYVTDRAGGRVEVLEETIPTAPIGGIAEAPCALETVATLSVSPGTSRGLAFSADGSRLYLAGGTEGALRVYDTTVGRGGRARNRLIASIPLGDQPGEVRVAGCRPCECPSSSETPCDPRAPVTENTVNAKGLGLVYVSMFEDDRVLVVDPNALIVLDRIETGRGPHAMEFMVTGAGVLRGYVANFDSSSISVVDLEPGSETRFSVVDTIQ